MSSFFLPSRIELYTEAVDLRKGEKGLLALVEYQLEREVTEEVLFIFSNRSRNLIKCLFWDRTGFCILSKRLQRGRFVFPAGNQLLSIDSKSLRFFMDGLNLFS